MTIILLAFNKVYAQAPSISSFYPASGPTGTLVTISGSNLNNIDTILIGGVSAVKVSSKADTIVALVMPETVSGNIYISSIYGNTNSSSSFSITNNYFYGISQQGPKLVGSNAIGSSNQGSSVKLSADGNTAIIGGPLDNGGKGAAWIFIRNGTTWTQQGTKLIGSGAIGNANQGNSVALSADGNTALVAGYKDSSSYGAVWVFIRTGNTWQQQGTKLVGGGADGFANQGFSVALSADGNTALIGGNNDNNGIGATWVFIRTGNTWSQQGGKLVGTSAIGKPNQGKSVAISADGNIALIGGQNDSDLSGGAWIFARTGNIWIQQGSKLNGYDTASFQTVYKFQAGCVAISADGKIALLCETTGYGKTWCFFKSGNVWIQQGNNVNSNTPSGLFSFSISGDGKRTIIGNQVTGNSRIAGRTYGTYWNTINYDFSGAGAIGSSKQGASVAVSLDGNTYLVGGNNDNSGVGATWVFSDRNTSKLSNITLSNGTLSPVFNSDSFNYSATVNNAYSSITLTPYKSYDSAVYSIQIRINNGNYVNINSGSASNPLIINFGTNIINVKVTSQSGKFINTYTIIVTRTPTKNANLSNIYSIGSSYSPTFNPYIINYTSSVLFVVDKVKISPIIADTTARIQLKINNENYESINSKDTSKFLNLNIGLNTIYIKVIAQDTSVTKIYTININRANAVTPYSLKYSDTSIVATRGITNINTTPTYLGDSIIKFTISPALPSGVVLDSISGKISGIAFVISPLIKYTITGTNSGGSTTASFTLLVKAISPSA
ncbi:MAG: cadherin-like beta sandwich domain-containing protein, partial [Bacteroidota bacterium]